MSRRLRIGCEQLEARIVLDGGGFAGNDCPPDLDLSAVDDQTATVGQLFTFDLIAAGAIIVDLDASGGLTGDDLVFLLDPDVPDDTPLGASITDQGVFSWTPTAEQEGAHTIVVILVDEGTPALADAETFEITVEAAPNAAPAVDLNGAADGTSFTATFIEDEGPVAITAPDATIIDPDSANLSSATVSLVSLFDGAAETLSVDTMATGIVASYDDTTGVLSLNGVASVADYEAVLRTLAYDNSSDDPDLTTRQVDVVVNDGTADSATVSAMIEMTAVNDAPNLAPIADMTAVVGTEFTVTVTATDAEGDTLTFFLDPETAPENATIEQIDNTTAIIRWTPQESDGAGPHDFTVLVSDSAAPAGVDSEQFSLTVNMAAPVVDLNGNAEGLDFAATWVEGAGPVLLVDPGASITDSNDAELSSVTVTLTSPLDGADETLSVDTTGTTISATYDTATGVMTLSGIASLTDYEMVLRTLRYDNASEAPDTTDRQITVAADDGNGLGNPSTTVLAIEEVNNAPNLILPAPYDDETTPVEVATGDTVTFVATVIDVDDEAAALTFTLDLDGSGIPDGSAMPVIDSATGEFTWETDIAGCFSITVLVTDAGGMADQETFLVLVEDAPAAAAQATSTSTVAVPTPAVAGEPDNSPQSTSAAVTQTAITNESVANRGDFEAAMLQATDQVFAELGAIRNQTAISSRFDRQDDAATTVVEEARIAFFSDQPMSATYELERMDRMSALDSDERKTEQEEDVLDHELEDVEIHDVLP